MREDGFATRRARAGLLSEGQLESGAIGDVDSP